jgi:hypothetical protein
MLQINTVTTAGIPGIVSASDRCWSRAPYLG